MEGEGIKYFQVLVWPGGGTIGVILWLISVVTVAVIVEHLVSIRRSNVLPDLIRAQIEECFRNKQYREVIELTAGEPSFLSYVVHAGLAEAAHGYSAMARAMEEASEERTTKLLRHIEWLNLIGNISPMLGLLGTVWGMIRAFFTLAQKGGAVQPKDLAGDIGIALVTTLLGLAVAIPALSVYGLMRNRIDSLSSEAVVASQDLISAFRPAKTG